MSGVEGKNPSDVRAEGAPQGLLSSLESEAPRRLEDILRSLPESELMSLVSRMRIGVDANKRIDVAAQVARALVSLPEIRETERLPGASRELLLRVAQAGGVLQVPTLPPGSEQLSMWGVLFARRIGSLMELVLPTAFFLQLKSWDGEDPRSLRALLAQASFESASAIAAHYLGRPATPPILLSLEVAWEHLRFSDRLQHEIERLAPLERRILEAIERVGGEVDTEELLDLEREPLRMRGAVGVASTRRGAGFSLERRAFLIPIHPNRHVIPTEVARIVGAPLRVVRERKRKTLRSFIVGEDHAPRRARFSSDPGALAVALACAVRDQGVDVRPAVGTPRSLLLRLAARFGRTFETVALLSALSRALGLWDPVALATVSPPGALSLAELTQKLFLTWRQGGAWDEARKEPEVRRAGMDAREPSPIAGLRELFLEALRDLGEGRWIPWQAFEEYLLGDERVAGIERLLRRWFERGGSTEMPAAREVLRRIGLETLPALGVLDLDEAGDSDGAVRLTARGRALLCGAPASPMTPSEFFDQCTVRIGSAASVGHVLALAQAIEVHLIHDQLEIALSPAALSRALSGGAELASLRSRLERLVALPSSVERLFEEATTVLGRVSLVPASGFLWIENKDLRDLLLSRRGTADLFVDPSPPSGLLIAAGVERDKLIRRVRGAGIEVEVEEGRLRARASLSPTNPRGDGLLPKRRR